MSEIDVIADELERAYDGDPWHGSSVTRILSGVTAAQAAARPLPAAHSIWELVFHMTGWVREVHRRMGGAKAGDPPEGDFPPVTDPRPEAWAAALTDLGLAHRELIAAVRRLAPSDLNGLAGRATPNAPRIPHRNMLHGLAQHDAYHAGQIALLKKGLGS